MPTEAPVTLLRIGLTEELLNHFEAVAITNTQPLEEAIAEHLARTRDYTDTDAMYLDTAKSREIRRLLGARVNTPDALISMLRRLASWKVGGYKIELTPNQQEQIAWYARSLCKSVEEVAPGIIEEAIAQRLQTR